MPGPRALMVMLLGRSSWSLKIECREKVMGKKVLEKSCVPYRELNYSAIFYLFKRRGCVCEPWYTDRYCIKVFDDVWLCMVCFILFSLDVCKCSFLMSCSSCRFDHNCSQLQFSVHVNC